MPVKQDIRWAFRDDVDRITPEDLREVSALKHGREANMKSFWRRRERKIEEMKRRAETTPKIG